MNFVYTRCKTVCPLKTRELKKLQETLGPLMGKEVLFLSITIDPKPDTAELSRQHGDGNGVDSRNWRFLTGPGQKIRRVLQAYHVSVRAKKIPGHPEGSYELGHGRLRPGLAMRPREAAVRPAHWEIPGGQLQVGRHGPGDRAGPFDGLQGCLAPPTEREVREGMATRVAHKALQIHGGYGYTKEYRLERYYRDARLFEIFQGTSGRSRGSSSPANWGFKVKVKGLAEPIVEALA
jgi:hypothetical protein